MIDGLAVVDKPPGMTSHDVVGRCRKVFGQRRVGHAGTLDPDATGVLLVGLGRATRLLQFLTGHHKTYEAEVVLGVATTTLDAAGEITGTWDMAGVTVEDARAAAVGLTGAIDQVPPMVSALKVGGKRLHQLAREGIEVVREPRRVEVGRFEVDAAPGAEHGPLGGGPILAIAVDCSAGTYVRTLAADLGTALGGGAHLRALRRLAVGPFTVADAVPLDDIGPDHVLTPADALGDMARTSVTGELATMVGHGRVLDEAQLGVSAPGPWAVVDDAGDLLAVYGAHGGGRAKPVVVLAAQDR